MAASPPPPKGLSAGGGARISLFLNTDLGTHLALNVAADSTIRGLKSQVAMEHAAAFPDIGSVAVKSFQVRRKGAMYHLSDSMAVRSAFAKVKAGYFLHVKMAAVEADTQYRRDEDRGRSSDVLPPLLKGVEDAGAWVTVCAHDVHLSSSPQQNVERKSTAVCLATDVQTVSVPVIDKSKSYMHGKKHTDQTEGVYVNATSVANVNGLKNESNVTLLGKEVLTREEDLLHTVGDHELGLVSGDKQMGIREETLGEPHALDDLSQEKNLKKARVTGSFDASAVEPIRETNSYKTRDVENFEKRPLDIKTNSREVLSNTSFQQEVDGNIKEDSIQLENPVLLGKNKKRKKNQLATSKDVSAQEMTEPSTGAVGVPKAIGEDLIHENQGLQGDRLNSESQVTKHVQLGTDAHATSDLAAGQSNIDLVHEEHRNPIVGDISISTCKVVAGEEKSAKGTNDGDHDESAVDASNMEKGGKSKDVLETLDNISNEKNCKQSKKVSAAGLTSMDTAEAEDRCRYGEKASKPDTISTQQEIVNGPCKGQTASNVQQGIENPNGDVKRKRKRRKHPETKDDPTQDVAKSSGFIMNASTTQDTSSRCLDAKQITLGNIGEETADEKDQCRSEKVAEPVIVSTQGMSVNDPSYVQQGASDVIKNLSGDGKRKKKKKSHMESSKDDPTQGVPKSSGLVTNGSSIQNRSADPLNAEQMTTCTIGEATVSDSRKFDETVDVAATNVINQVLEDLKCTDNLSKVLNGDPLMEQTKGGVSAALLPSAIQSDPPISSPSHKSKGKPVRILSAGLDPSHSSVGLPGKNACTELRESDSLMCSDKVCDLKDVLAESIVVPADGRIKSTKRQRNKLSLKPVPTDSGKAIQSLGEQVGHVPAEELKGENCTKAELFQGGSAIDAPSITGQILQKKSKRSSKSRTTKIEEVNHFTHGQENQFANNSQDKHVADIGVTHNNKIAVGAPRESPLVHKDDTTVACDRPNARKGRKKSSKTELQSLDTNLEHGSNADFMNSRAQQGAVIPEGSSDAMEPNDHVVVHHDNDKINFIDHFSPSVRNGPSYSEKDNDETLREVSDETIREVDDETIREVNDETIREVKDKKKSKRKADTQSEHDGSIEPNYLPESHVHTDQTSLADHFGTGNVGVPSVSAENMNREDGNMKKAKGKKKSKGKPDLIKPESVNHLMHSDVQKGRIEQYISKEKKNDSMLQQETENSTRDSTKKDPPSMFGADSQTNLPIKKDHSRMSKEQRSSSSQTKGYDKNRKHDGSIYGRTSTNRNAVSNLVQSFPMSPQASNESTYGTPAAKRFRVAVRKVPRKTYGQVKDKSKKDISKRGTGTIFGDTISESSDEVLNTTSQKAAMENASSASADSGISSAALYESDVPDDDEIASLSQKSDIHSILRGSRSYEKARLKPTELLDDTEVPDSQPPF